MKWKGNNSKQDDDLWGRCVDLSHVLIKIATFNYGQGTLSMSGGTTNEKLGKLQMNALNIYMNLLAQAKVNTGIQVEADSM